MGEPRGKEVEASLRTADLVVASALTALECERVLLRSLHLRRLPEADVLDRQARLARAADGWLVFGVDGEILDRARRPFPREPVRTLDALHLATALTVRSLMRDLVVLSLDDRVREAAGLLGFEVLPPAVAG